MSGSTGQRKMKPESTSLLKALIDFKFEQLATERIVGLVYVLGAIYFGYEALQHLSYALQSGEPFQMIYAVLRFLFMISLFRIVLEALLVVVRHFQGSPSAH